jgi:hypothetical protein
MLGKGQDVILILGSTSEIRGCAARRKQAPHTLPAGMCLTDQATGELGHIVKDSRCTLGMESEALIRALATGKASVSDLSPLGVLVEGKPPHWSVSIPSAVKKGALVEPRSSSQNDQTTGVVEYDPFLMRQGVGGEDTGDGAITDVP